MFVMWLAGNGDVLGARSAQHGEPNGDGYLGNPRKSGDARQVLIEEGALAFDRLILVRRKMYIGIDEALSADAGVEICDCQKAAEHETRKDKQEHGKRVLAHDRTGANAHATAGSTHVNASGLQVTTQIAFYGQESWRKAKEEGGQERKKNGEKESNATSVDYAPVEFQSRKLEI